MQNGPPDPAASEQHLLCGDVEAEQLARAWLHFSPTGYDSTKPNVIVKLEQGEEPWVAEGDFPCQSCPGKLVECHSFRNSPPDLWA